MNTYFCHSHSLSSPSQPGWVYFLPNNSLPHICALLFCSVTQWLWPGLSVTIGWWWSTGVWWIQQWAHDWRWWLALFKNPSVTHTSARRSRAIWVPLRATMDCWRAISWWTWMLPHAADLWHYLARDSRMNVDWDWMETPGSNIDILFALRS